MASDPAACKNTLLDAISGHRRWKHEAAQHRRANIKTTKGILYSKAHLWRLIRAGKFPRPIRLGENRIAFPEHEIEDWLKAKVVERDTPLEVA